MLTAGLGRLLRVAALGVAASLLPLVASAAEPGSGETVAVVQALHDALNAQDPEAAVALFADSATVEDDRTYYGPERIRGWVQRLVSGNARLRRLSTPSLRPGGHHLAAGEFVVWQASLSLDVLERHGVREIDGWAEAVVRDGQIRFLSLSHAHTLGMLGLPLVDFPGRLGPAGEAAVAETQSFLLPAPSSGVAVPLGTGAIALLLLSLNAGRRASDRAPGGPAPKRPWEEGRLLEGLRQRVEHGRAARAIDQGAAEG